MSLMKIAKFVKRLNPFKPKIVTVLVLGTPEPITAYVDADNPNSYVYLTPELAFNNHKNIRCCTIWKIDGHYITNIRYIDHKVIEP